MLKSGKKLLSHYEVEAFLLERRNFVAICEIAHLVNYLAFYGEIILLGFTSALYSLPFTRILPFNTNKPYSKPS